MTRGIELGYKKTVKRKIAQLILSIFLSSIIFAPFANAAGSASITATVTVQNVAIELFGTDGAVAYGTLGLDDTKNTTSTGINDTEVLKNTGNVTEDFTIKGSNSDAWTLVETKTDGANQYYHEYCHTTCDSTPTWTKITVTETYQSFKSSVTSTSTVDLDLKITTPTTTSSYSSQSVNVYVLATASS